MRSVLLVFALVGTSSVAHAAARERQKIAVLDLEARGVEQTIAAALTDIDAVELKKLGVFDVISRTDIQQMLDFEATKQLIGCGAGQCIAEIGGALGVAKVVNGSIRLTYTLSQVVGITGGVLLATGIVLFFAGRAKDRQHPSLVPFGVGSSADRRD